MDWFGEVNEEILSENFFGDARIVFFKEKMKIYLYIADGMIETKGLDTYNNAKEWKKYSPVFEAMANLSKTGMKEGTNLWKAWLKEADTFYKKSIAENAKK